MHQFLPETMVDILFVSANFHVLANKREDFPGNTLMNLYEAFETVLGDVWLWQTFVNNVALEMELLCHNELIRICFFFIE